MRISVLAARIGFFVSFILVLLLISSKIASAESHVSQGIPVIVPENVLRPLAPTKLNTASVESEMLVAQFSNGINAVTTRGEYSGLITITVSGIGQASATQYSDAFYLLTNIYGDRIQPYHPNEYYNWVLWINGQHAEDLIPGKQIPNHREDQTYTFQVEAPGGRLTFGVGDAYTLDNTGSYVITVGDQNIQDCAVPFFSQRDPRWIDHPLRTTGACSASCGTIGACGCTLTSAAMIFSYYGSATNPQILSDCMWTKACPFHFDPGTTCMGNTTFVGIFNFSWERLDKELNEDNRPLIVELRHASKYPHWVVVTGGSGDDPSNYIINDPWAFDGGDTNLNAYVRQGYYLNRLAVYDGEPTCNESVSAGVRVRPDFWEPSEFATASTTAVSGSVILNKLYETSLVVRLAAESTAGEVSEMQVWTDSKEEFEWHPFSEFFWLPWEPGDRIYARFRDELGNVSEIYADTSYPVVGPPDPLLSSAEQVLLPMITAD